MNWNDKFPSCNHPGRCVSSDEGKCRALRDTEFRRDCPFFQTAGEFTKACEASIDRLFHIGRYDLLEKYYCVKPSAAVKIFKESGGVAAFARSISGGLHDA